jgi:hypothetical protein
MKIKGHSLNGRKLILNPVKNETKAKIRRTTTELRYIAKEIELVWSIAVTTTLMDPIKIRAIPSIIHSIVMIRLLSAEISPNPATTDFVGKRWAIPQNEMKAEPE